MKPHSFELSVTDLQTAVREFVEKHAKSQPELVFVDNGYGKTVLILPLAPGAVIYGLEFQRQTEVS